MLLGRKHVQEATARLKWIVDRGSKNVTEHDVAVAHYRRLLEPGETFTGPFTVEICATTGSPPNFSDRVRSSQSRLPARHSAMRQFHGELPLEVISTPEV